MFIFDKDASRSSDATSFRLSLERQIFISALKSSFQSIPENVLGVKKGKHLVAEKLCSLNC